MEAEKVKLYVGGIARETTEEALREHFGKYGDVSHAVVPKERDARTPKGFAFVWFIDPASAKTALEEEEHVILGKKVLVKEANRPDHHPNQQEARLGQIHSCRMCGNNFNGSSANTRFRSKKIFVGGLPTSLTEEEFKNFFERFGETTDVVIMLDLYRRPRGFGFVTFALEESVEDVMKNNFYELHGRFVEVKRAIPKEARNFYNGSCEVNGQIGRGWDCRDYWPVYYPPYPSPYESFHGYGHFSSYHEFEWVPYGARAYSVSHAVHFNGSGPAYMDDMYGYTDDMYGYTDDMYGYRDDMFGYYGMPIPTYNGFMPNGFNATMSQAVCIENVSNTPALPQIEELKLTDGMESRADTPALPGIKELKLSNGSESDGGNSDVTNQKDDH